MLREIRGARQIKGEPLRQCFSSVDMDIIVWNDDQNNFTEFQFCYGKERVEKVIMWHINKGFSFMVVDSGENGIYGSYKATPIMEIANSDGVDFGAVIESFNVRSSLLPQQVREFVRLKLLEFHKQSS